MQDSAKEHWYNIAQEFDTSYKKEKGALKRALDKIFRKNMIERVNLTLQGCRNVKGKKILDIGCGLGHTATELIKRGANVVGVSSNVNATRLIKEEYVLMREDFLNSVFDETFDITIALGFFDHTEDPTPYLEKMKLLTREKCVMSFPSQFAFQVPIRMIWLKSKKYPAYFYTKKKIKRLFYPIFPRFKIKNISAGYYCVAYPAHLFFRKSARLKKRARK